MPRNTPHRSERPIRRRRTAAADASPATGPRPVAATSGGEKAAAAIERQAAASQALFQIADGLGAEIVAVWLRDARRVDTWLLARPASEPARLAGQSLRSLPTVRRVLGAEGLSLTGCRGAPDIAALCRLAGFPSTGHFVLEPIAADEALGVLLAGRASEAWSPADRAMLQTVARHMANRLRAVAAARPSARRPAELWPLGVAALGQIIARASRLASSVVAAARRQLSASHEPRRRSPAHQPRLGPASDERHGRQVAPGRSPTHDHPSRRAALEPSSDGLPGAPSDTEQPKPASPADRDEGGPRPPPTEALTLDARPASLTGIGEGALADVSRPPSSGDATPSAERAVGGPSVRSLSILSAAEPSGGRARFSRRREPAVTDQTSSALAATRLRCYGLAMDELPWGILLLDRESRVVVANRTAAHLLHFEDIPPGIGAAPLFPEPSRASYALRNLAAEARDDQACQHVLFEASRLRADLQPLRHPLAGYAGAVVTLFRQTTLPASNTAPLLAQLAAAMKAPLGSIGRYRDVLRRGRAADESTMRLVGRIEANLSRLQILLDDLAAAATLCRDADTPQSSTAIAIPELVRESARRTGPQFAEKDVELLLTIHEPVPPASAQAAAAAILVDNLLLNAARRSPPASTVQIEVAAHSIGSDQGVVIAVADAGPPPAPGSLGLLEVDCGGEDATMALVRLLAERQGARAWAESHPQGTRFCLRLSARRRIA